MQQRERRKRQPVRGASPLVPCIVSTHGEHVEVHLFNPNRTLKLRRHQAPALRAALEGL